MAFSELVNAWSAVFGEICPPHLGPDWRNPLRLWGGITKIRGEPWRPCGESGLPPVHFGPRHPARRLKPSPDWVLGAISLEAHASVDLGIHPGTRVPILLRLQGGVVLRSRH